jgi:hypothetical protein
MLLDLATFYAVADEKNTATICLLILDPHLFQLTSDDNVSMSRFMRKAFPNPLCKEYLNADVARKIRLAILIYPPKCTAIFKEGNAAAI